MKTALSHDRGEESIEKKTLWFRALPLPERMEMLCSFTDLALTLNPKLQERPYVKPASGRIQIISAT